jgi:hypothetical protein
MSVKALVNCRATGNFINSEYIIYQNLPVCWLSQRIPVLNVDDSPNLSGSTSSIVDMVVDYKGHSKRMQLAVMRLGNNTSSSAILSSRNIIQRLTGRPRKSQ